MRLGIPRALGTGEKRVTTCPFPANLSWSHQHEARCLWPWWCQAKGCQAVCVPCRAMPCRAVPCQRGARRERRGGIWVWQVPAEPSRGIPLGTAASAAPSTQPCRALPSRPLQRNASELGRVLAAPGLRDEEEIAETSQAPGRRGDERRRRESFEDESAPRVLPGQPRAAAGSCSPGFLAGGEAGGGPGAVLLGKGAPRAPREPPLGARGAREGCGMLAGSRDLCRAQHVAAGLQQLPAQPRSLQGAQSPHPTHRTRSAPPKEAGQVWGNPTQGRAGHAGIWGQDVAGESGRPAGEAARTRGILE